MGRDEIVALLAKTIKAEFKLELEPEVDYADPQFGDFATNAPFAIAKQLVQNPREIAVKLAAAIKVPEVESAEAAGGGYVNIRLTDSVWLQELAKISPKYGSGSIGKGQKVQVEFISANPTGPLTLGNARGGFIGDVLARVLVHSGYNVTREYYFNDAGSQIGKLVESVKAAAGLIHPEEIQYKGEYIQKLADDFKADLKTKSDAELGQLMTQSILKEYLFPAIVNMNIGFDLWFNEKDLAGQPFEAAIERLKQVGLYEEKDGAVWAKTSKLGDERDRPVVKSNGDVTYLGSDIAYHLNIFEKRGFDKAIKVWGADHAGQVPSLKLTMQKLCPGKQLDFLILQFVRLMRDGQEVKMSKRAGTYVTTDELIEQVGADVARFFFLMRSADSHMDFDLSLAKEEGQKNPYWYVMYAYVRANSILTKAKAKGLEPGPGLAKIDDRQRNMAKLMSQLPELVESISHSFEVHRLTFFGTELAKLFHDYYEGKKILELPAKEAKNELYFVQQLQTFMRVYFEILGLKPAEKM